MKPYLHMLAGIMFLAVSCTTTQQTQRYDDDVYGPAPSAGPVSNQNSTESSYDDAGNYDSGQYDEGSYTETEGGDTYITNNYNGDNYSYDHDDYYDYAYSSRIRRFHNPIVTYSYYDPWYTNNYWYSYDPFFYGTSIYVGYSWWRPRPWNSWGCSYSWSWGWNCGVAFGWGYPSAYNYNPFYPYGWGGSYGYWSGYNHGYWNGYYDGLYNGLASDYYYNSYDQNSHYYGPRTASTGSGSGTGPRTNRLGNLYEAAVEKDNPRSQNRVVDDNKNTTRSATDVLPSNRPAVRNTQPDSDVRNRNDVKPEQTDALPARENTTPARPGEPTRETPERTAPVRQPQPAREQTQPAPQREPSVQPRTRTQPEAPQRQVTPRPQQPASPSTPRTPQYQAPQERSQPVQRPSFNRGGTQPSGSQERTSRPSGQERPAVNYNRPSSRPQYNYNRPSRTTPSRSAPVQRTTPTRPSSRPSISTPSRSAPRMSTPSPSRNGGSMPSRSRTR